MSDDHVRKALEDSVDQIIHLGPRHEGVVAFSAFRRGVMQAAGGDKSRLAGLVENIGPKIQVLDFLLSFQDQKRVYRKQVVEVMTPLLQVDSWLTACRDNEKLCSRLCSALPGFDVKFQAQAPKQASQSHLSQQSVPQMQQLRHPPQRAHAPSPQHPRQHVMQKHAQQHSASSPHGPPQRLPKRSPQSPLKQQLTIDGHAKELSTLIVSGARGRFATFINGRYKAVDALHSGQRQWRKVDNKSLWLACSGKHNTWTISHKADRDRGGAGYMWSAEPVASPLDVKEWTNSIPEEVREVSIVDEEVGASGAMVQCEDHSGCSDQLCVKQPQAFIQREHEAVCQSDMPDADPHGVADHASSPQQPHIAALREDDKFWAAVKQRPSLVAQIWKTAKKQTITRSVCKQPGQQGEFRRCRFVRDFF
jgi:hypothetical protein